MSIPNAFRPVCGGGGGELPPGYKRVDFFVTTRWIYLDLITTEDTVHRVKFSVGGDAMTSYFFVAGAATTQDIATCQRVLTFPNINGLALYYDTPTIYAFKAVGVPYTLDTVAEVVLSPECVEYNGKRYASPKQGDTYPWEIAVGMKAPRNCRIYYYTIIQGGETVCNLLAAEDNHGVPCLYDTVRMITYYN